WKDLYSANGDVDYVGNNSKQHETMWRNLGGQKFEDVSAQLGADFMPLGYHRGSAFADLNNDGAMDLVVTALDERPRILVNSGNGNHWLTLDLIGHKSNRDAIGAEVKVTTQSGRTLYNHVTTSVGFMGSSDRRVHFGLGAEKSVRSIEIHWPSGITQAVANPPVDRIMKIDEGS
ncbi:MAG: CRTAC1 family protein, partial [Bryobacteraceae bacterium]